MTNLSKHSKSTMLIILSLILSACDSRISSPGLKSVVVPVPSILDFGNFDTTQILTLQSSRGDNLRWKVQSTSKYVEISPDSGCVSLQPDTLTIRVHRTPRNIGTFTHNITLTDFLNEKKSTIQVKFNNIAPELVLSPSVLDFGRNSDSLTLFLTNSGSRGLSWSVIEEFPWCTVNPNAGYLNRDRERVDVLLNRDSLPPGELTKTIIFRHAQSDKELHLNLLEGEMIMESNFESVANFNEFWNIWDQDSSQPYGLDTWGIVHDTDRGGNVLWSNGQGSISTGVRGHDGGINANLDLKAEKQLDLSRYKMVTYQLQILREFQWQDELLRLYFSGFEGGALVSFSSSSNGWESFDYTFSNHTRFQASMDIEINYLTPQPVEGKIGAKIDDLEVWVK